MAVGGALPGNGQRDARVDGIRVAEDGVAVGEDACQDFKAKAGAPEREVLALQWQWPKKKKTGSEKQVSSVDDKQH